MCHLEYAASSLSRSRCWGLHQPNWHAVWKWLPISVCVCVLYFLLPDNQRLGLSRLAPWGALFCITIKDTYVMCNSVEQLEEFGFKPTPKLSESNNMHCSSGGILKHFGWHVFHISVRKCLNKVEQHKQVTELCSALTFPVESRDLKFLLKWEELWASFLCKHRACNVVYRCFQQVVFTLNCCYPKLEQMEEVRYKMSKLCKFC